jgi:hypothetical protein
MVLLLFLVLDLVITVVVQVSVLLGYELDFSWGKDNQSFVIESADFRFVDVFAISLLVNGTLDVEVLDAHGIVLSINNWNIWNLVLKVVCLPVEDLLDLVKFPRLARKQAECGEEAFELWVRKELVLSEIH